MHLSKDSIISDVINSNPERILIFDKFGIEFCNNSNISIIQASLEKNIDLNILIMELGKFEDGTGLLHDWQNWSLDFLITYLLNNHHYRLKSELSGELSSSKLFNFAYELTVHLMKEEKMVFPYIRKIEKIYNEDLEYEYPNFGSIKKPVQVLKKEHRAICDELKRILIEESDSENISLMNTIKNNFHIHVYLVESILFPRAIAIEEKLIEKNNNTQT